MLLPRAVDPSRVARPLPPPSNSFQSTRPATPFPPQTFKMPQVAAKTLPSLPQVLPPTSIYSLPASAIPMASVGAVPMARAVVNNQVVVGVDMNRDGIPDSLQQPQGFAARPAYPSYSQVAPLATSMTRAPPLPIRTAPSLVRQQAPRLPMRTAPNLVAQQFPGYAQGTVPTMNSQSMMIPVPPVIYGGSLPMGQGSTLATAAKNSGISAKATTSPLKKDAELGIVGKVEAKVAGFFGHIGSLFHGGGGDTAHPETGVTSKADDDHAGPAGTKLGVGSSVQVIDKSGNKFGHIVTMPGAAGWFHSASDVYQIQCHQDARGKLTAVHEPDLKPFESYHPVVGTGVEVLHDEKWYSGHITALPADDQDKQDRWTVQCHDDPLGILTFADENSIRPLLSAQEHIVLKGALLQERADATGAAKKARADATADAAAKLEAARVAAAKKAAADAKRAADNAKKAADDAAANAEEAAAYKQFFADNGLADFHQTFVGNGYNTYDETLDLTDDDLKELGLKKGHIAKFHKAFPRGLTYIMDNSELKSKSAGLGYRTTKSFEGDAHNTAEWGSKVVGVDQHDGWLKAGIRFLPMELEMKDGKFRTMYIEGEGPKTTVQKVTGAALAAEQAVVGAASSALHGMEHMFGFGASATTPAAAEEGESAVESAVVAVVSAGESAVAAVVEKEAAPVAKAGDAGVVASVEAGAADALASAEGAVGGMLHKMHLW